MEDRSSAARLAWRHVGQRHAARRWTRVCPRQQPARSSRPLSGPRALDVDSAASCHVRGTRSRQCRASVLPWPCADRVWASRAMMPRSAGRSAPRHPEALSVPLGEEELSMLESKQGCLVCKGVARSRFRRSEPTSRSECNRRGLATRPMRKLLAQVRGGRRAAPGLRVRAAAVDPGRPVGSWSRKTRYIGLFARGLHGATAR